MKTVNFPPGLRAHRFEGINSPRLGLDPSGKPMIFKSNRFQAATAREEDGNASEVLASRLFVKELGLAGVTVEPAVSADGQTGVASLFLPGRISLAQADPTVIDPLQLAPMVVARDFLGDWDSSTRNYMINAKGKIEACDFGSAPHKGLPAHETGGLIEKALQEYSEQRGLESLLKPLRELTDRQIKGMVKRAGRGLNPCLQKDFVEALVHNRDLLRRSNPYPFVVTVNRQKPASL